jgi:hypothetical protein
MSGWVGVGCGEWGVWFGTQFQIVHYPLSAIHYPLNRTIDRDGYAQ